VGLTKNIFALFLMVLAFLFSAKSIAASNTEVIMISDTAEKNGAPSKDLNLLRWVSTGQNRKPPGAPYDRKEQFGSWIHFRKTPGCLDTRAQVLVRDSLVKATSTDDKPCTIEKGEWLDPYTNQKIFSDDEVQIDHMVPLKEAYEAGASEWARSKRCVYANFLGMKEHLIATSNHENMSKGDQTPEGYLPPNKDYQCTYLKNWLTVKLIWKLSMTPSESEAIRRLVKDSGCNESDFVIARSKVVNTRRIALGLEGTCPVPRSELVRQLVRRAQ
jgi:hypothetical protein